MAARSHQQQESIDPDFRLLYPLDMEFAKNEGVGTLPLPAEVKWSEIKSLPIPHINVDEEPDPITVLTFLHKIRQFPTQDPKILVPIMMEAFQGSKGRSWCESANFNLELTINRLVNWMTERREWIGLKGKMELGEPFSDDMDTHIMYFKLVALYSGLSASSDLVKQYFIKSIKGVSMSDAKDPRTGKFRSFQEIVDIAKANKKTFEQVRSIESALAKIKEEGVAAAAAAAEAGRTLERMRKQVRVRSELNANLHRPPYRKHEFPRKPSKAGKPLFPRKVDSSRIKCFHCGKIGHFARDCVEGSKRLSEEIARNKYAKARPACLAIERNQVLDEVASSDSDSE